jgi:2-iminobutanoate/2-iminopropanoate deaminase
MEINMSKSLISRAIKTNNLVFCSGMTGEGPDTGAQIRDIFAKVESALKEFGSSLNNIISATVYLTDLADRPKYLNPIWSEYFPQNPPTRTTIQVGLGPPAKVEITVIATCPE